MPPPHFCAQRKTLYKHELKDTESFLAGLLTPANGFSEIDGDRLRRALVDQGLIDALEEILIPYVIPGVARDLQRLRASGALYVTDKSGVPLDIALPLGKPSPTGPLVGYDHDDSVSAKEAYGRYFQWYINPKDLGNAKSGVTAFYERYPLTDHGVKTVASHYRDNLGIACTRVKDDWNDIENTFSPGPRLSRLLKIQTTGNDFHKGGKQVLILTFEVEGGGEVRVVYKPSAVEIDCRIVGDSSVFQGISPKGVKDTMGYTQTESLSEIVNRHNPPRMAPEGYSTCPLPTYKILPYNRGSIPDAYGYIEFLSHEPHLDVEVGDRTLVRSAVGAAIRTLTPNEVKDSDWIVPAGGNHAQVFYHQFGGLMAMVMAVSQCDLHVQNMIVHSREPYLIDLEEALKWPAPSVSRTYLAGTPNSPLGNYYDPSNPQLNLTGDGTDKLKIDGLFPWIPPSYRPVTSALYIYSGPGVPGRPAHIEGTQGSAPEIPKDDSRSLRRALLRGFVETIDALASQECNQDVKEWVKKLDRVIARYVVRPTSEYAKSRRELFTFYFESAIRPNASDADYDTVVRTDMPEFFFRSAVNGTRSEWLLKRSQLTDPEEIAWLRPPAFVGEHPDHAWRDYLNCDVPAFYHFLGSKQLLNSKGDPVDVMTAWRWQQDHIIGATKFKPPADWDWSVHDYLPQTPIEMVVAQLDQLRTACAPSGGQRKPTFVRRGDPKAEFLKRALDRTGLADDFSRLDLATRLREDL